MAKRLKHGHCKNGKSTRIYKCWDGMRDRCNNPKNPMYRYYGGKGVFVCKEWDDFQVFHDWAMAHGYTDELTIDRVRDADPYCPGNCEWVTMSENLRRSHVSGKVRKTRQIKFTADVALEIKTMFAAGVSKRDICKKFDLKFSNVQHVINGRTWPEVAPHLTVPAQPIKKLTDEQVVEIKESLLRGEVHSRIAARYGVDRTTITAINRCKNRKGVVLTTAGTD